MQGLSTRITFNDDQAMLLDIATKFCREKISIGDVRRHIASESNLDQELWKE